MKIEKLLKNGCEGYGPAVMWFTSGEVDEKEMTYQLEGFCSHGLRDFFIHPVLGTIKDYLGPYFFRMVRHARNEAKRLGMNYWIYDEYNWSSGIAAGQVLKNAPWAHGSCLWRIEKDVPAGACVCIPMPERARFHTELLLATKNGAAFSPTVEGDSVLYRNESAAPERIELFVSKWDLGKIAALKNSPIVENEEGYLDTLDPEAVDAFISSTHEKYKNEIGEDFGGCVKGVFCDEVITYFDFRDEGEEEIKTLPWSRCFAERFRRLKGYDIIPRLHDLFLGEDKCLLVDYWESVAAMMMEGFAGRTYDWCRKNSLLATGHIDGEESIFSQVYRSGDMYEFYKRFDVPGIDSILTYFRTGDYTFAITPKLVSSAAHFLHKERILCETFTISGWEITLADMKRAINKLLVLGVNLVQYMGARYDFQLAANAQAMTNNFQNPLFKHYGALSRYTESLQAFVAKTEYDAHLLLFYPMTTARTVIHGRTLVGEWDHPMNMTLSGAVNSLLSLQIPFEIGFEQVIDGAQIRDGRILVDGRYYDTLILPETEYLKKATFEKIYAFAESGGKLIALNGKPLKIVGESITDAPKIPSMIECNTRAYEFAGENHPTCEHGQPFDGYQCAPMGAFTSALKAAVGEIGGYPLSIEAQDGILSAFRKDEEGYYVLIVNDKAESATVLGCLPAETDAALYDTVSGEERVLKREGDAFSLALAPFESAILVLGQKSTVTEAPVKKEAELPLSDIAFSILGENLAHPKMHQLRGALAARVIEAHLAGDSAAVCALALEANEENSVLCRGLGCPYLPEKGKRNYFGWTPIDKGKPRPGETVACIYDFTLDFSPKRLSIVCDGVWGTVYYLNGVRLQRTSTERIWHGKNAVYDIASNVRVGENRLVAVCTLPQYQRDFPLPAPVLKGDFRLYSDLVLTSREGEGGLGPWNQKGYTCYGGDGLYGLTFEYSGEGTLCLSLDTKDTVEIIVNGQSVARLFCAPYLADITRFAIKGENSLSLRLTSTLSNFIYKPSFSGINSIKLISQK